MTPNKITGILFSLLLFVNTGLAQRTFTDFEEFKNYAFSKSISLQNGAIQITEAEKAKLASIVGIVDPQLRLSASFINNTQLPVSLIPSEVLGGEAGTFQEVQFGLQYETNTQFHAELQLLNLLAWENLKANKLHILNRQVEQKIRRKQLAEDIATIYYNIILLQEQQKVTELNLKVSDSLSQSVQVKYEQGLLKQQNLNGAQVNKIQFEKSLKALEAKVEQQYIALKMLCDIPIDDAIKIEAHTIAETTIPSIPVDHNFLEVNQALNQEKLAFSNARRIKLERAPSLSFLFSSTNQQFNSRARLLDRNVNWIPSRYWGLQLNLPIPTANSIARQNKAKYRQIIANNTKKQAQQKVNQRSKQLQIDYEVALSKRLQNAKIFELRKDTYNRERLNFEEGINSLDQMLDSFIDMVNSNYDLVNTNVQVQLALSKIKINNTIK